MERAERTEEAVIVNGKTDSGLPVMVIVATGANVGLLRQYAANVLPGLKLFDQPREGG